MLRADYKKFFVEALAPLDKRYFLQTWRADPEYTGILLQITAERRYFCRSVR